MEHYSEWQSLEHWVNHVGVYWQSYCTLCYTDKRSSSLLQTSQLLLYLTFSRHIAVNLSWKSYINIISIKCSYQQDVQGSYNPLILLLIRCLKHLWKLTFPVGILLKLKEEGQEIANVKVDLRASIVKTSAW